MSRLSLLAASCFLILRLAAADGPTARDRYLEARSGDPAWIGTRTSIQLRREGSDANAVREVGESAQFRSGDRFRIRVQTNADGYVYLLARDPSQGYKMLFPSRGQNAKANRFRAFEPRALPHQNKEWLTFDNSPAIEGLFLIFSAKPVPELDRLKQDGGTMPKGEFDDLMTRNGSTVSLLYDESGDDAGAIPATYYVEKRTTNRLFLVRQIDLIHRGTKAAKP